MPNHCNSDRIRRAAIILVAVVSASFLIKTGLSSHREGSKKNVTIAGQTLAKRTRDSIQKTENPDKPFATGRDPSVDRILAAPTLPMTIRSDLNTLDSKIAGRVPTSAEPGKCLAAVAGADGLQQIAADQIGLFPPVQVRATTPVRVELSTRPEESISVQVVDGGHLDGMSSQLQLEADASGASSFDFSSLKPAGTYRVAIDVSGQRLFLPLVVQ